jgi:bifunctional UDP-N-acetylglucosamine pyrophosphorylase/glucosamine-1-phosphate N-acetyltransferase
MISFILKTLAAAGIREVCIIIGFKGELMQSALGNGAEYGLDIMYVRQPKWTGTASALNVAREAMGDEPFLALYGDLMVGQSCIDSVLERARECPKVMGVARVSDPSRYGIVELRGDRVMKIREKPLSKPAREAWVNSGIYVLDRDIFRSASGTSRSRRNEYELTTSLQRLIDDGQEIRAAAIPREDWMDIGRPWDLLEANEKVLMNFTPQVKGTVDPGCTIKGPVWLEDSALVKSGSCIEGPAYIGRRTTVGPNSRIRPCTSIGDDANVGTSCEIKNSIIMSGSKVPHLSYIGDSIIGENCNLGAGTITANIRLDEKPISLKMKGRVSSSGRRKLGTIMGDGVQTGINASIMPGVRIGPASLIGPGVVVYEDVPAAHEIFARQSLVSRPLRHAAEHMGA